MSAQRYRKKPVEVEAIRLVDGLTEDEFCAFMGDAEFILEGKDGVSIHTLEGTMIAQPGDWIIRGVKGEFYPCKPDIFDSTYEAVES